MSGVLSTITGALSSIGSAIGSAVPYITAGVIVIAVVVGGVVCYHYFSRGEDNIQHVEQHASNSHPVENNHLPPPPPPLPELPDWQPLNVSDEDLELFDSLTSEEYSAEVQNYTCHLTKQVMRIPRILNCCSTNHQTRRAEECMLLNKEKCPYCNQKLKHSPDQNTMKAIKLFRIRIRKLMKSLHDQNQINQWTEKIESDFGIGYIANHL